MRIVLQKEVEKLGLPGDVVLVADGYARNYLIPKGYAAPATKGYVERYLGGRRGVGATNRLRIMNLVRDLLASDFGGYNELLSIHAEGSLEAQKLTILREFDAGAARGFAARCARIEA